MTTQSQPETKHLIIKHLLDNKGMPTSKQFILNKKVIRGKVVVFQKDISEADYFQIAGPKARKPSAPRIVFERGSVYVQGSYSFGYVINENLYEVR